MRQDPVFIFGAHKSGTSLLRNLLDGHPQLFTLPFESHFFQYYGHWVNNNYRYSTPKSYSRDQLVHVFTDFIQANNDSDDRFGDAFVHGRFNVESFRDLFADLNENHTIAQAFGLFIEASHRSLYGNALEEETVWVEKSVEHAEFAVEIRKAFPGSRFIHIVRNPYSNLVSLRRYKSLGPGYPLIHRVLQTLENSYYHLERNQRIFENYLVVKYEDLVTDPTEWMTNIASFLNIEFNEVLLNPTHMGEPWKGNSTTGTPFSGVSDQELESWKDEIDPMEAYYVNRMFPFIVEKYGYAELPYAGGFWKRNKGEEMRRYLANRFYKYYLT